jgi:hypothetical protein
VQLGSLVQTTTGVYFISIPWGKIEIDGKPIFVLSIGSPIGTLLQGKKSGESYLFQGKKLEIIATH